jgi:excinuclease UvrABC nuclease subunit
VLYVGKARDLSARLRSYFRGSRQRPALEAALEAVERVDWRLYGSELAAALEELRLIRELRPPANSRTPQPERYVYLRRRGEGVVVTRLPSAYGPIRRRSHADRAARALAGCSAEEFEHLLEGAALPRLRSKMRDAADCLHYEQARRLRDRIASLERVTSHLRRLEELRGLEVCLIAPALDEGWREAFFVAGGRIACRRRLPPGPGAELELRAGIAAARAAAAGGASLEPEHLDELTAIATFLDHPPPELEIVPFGDAASLRAA